jgi:hypothetical protein
MKLSDVKVGQKVLYNSRRANSPDYRAAASKAAEVIEIGVEHRYSVSVGGWNGHTEYRRTDQGIRIRYRNPEWDRHGFAKGEPDRPEFAETVVIAAYLQPAEGEALTKWEQAQAVRLVTHRLSEARETARKDSIRAFALAGYEVSVDGNGNVTFDAADIERLLTDLKLAEHLAKHPEVLS